MSARNNEELAPHEGPGLGCFITPAIVFAACLLLIASGLFTFHWPAWLLSAMLVIGLIALLGTAMTGVVLLREFFAARRRRRTPHAGVTKEDDTDATQS